MNIKFTIDANRVLAKLADAQARIPAQLNVTVRGLTLQLLARAQSRAPVLTGKLRRSIFQQVTVSDNQAVGRVLVSPDVEYAKIQEYGGKTKAHEIIASKAKALAFMAGGKQIFAKSVHHPGSNIPAKNYLHGAFEEMKPEIIAKIKEALRNG